MEKFDSHVEQAKRNLSFLQCINEGVPDCIDWQVTVCFYTALHLVNAHVAKFGLNYRTHQDISHNLNPFNQLAVARIDEGPYIAYTALQNLSRRSRYLVHEKIQNTQNDKIHRTFDKHLAKAIRHLDTIIDYFATKYNLSFPKMSLKCDGFGSASELKRITVNNAIAAK